MQNLNIRLGLVQKYIAFYEAKPEFAKSVGNMRRLCRIMQIYVVCATIQYNLARLMGDRPEARSSYNIRQNCNMGMQILHNFAIWH